MSGAQLGDEFLPRKVLVDKYLPSWRGKFEKMLKSAPKLSELVEGNPWKSADGDRIAYAHGKDVDGWKIAAKDWAVERCVADLKALAGKDAAVHYDLTPEPFIGNLRDVRLVSLNFNPGVSTPVDDDAKTLKDLELRGRGEDENPLSLVERNLLMDESAVFYYSPSGSFARKGGHDYYFGKDGNQKILGQLRECALQEFDQDQDLVDSVLKRRYVSMEAFAYHSEDGEEVKKTVDLVELPTSMFQIEILKYLLSKEVIIVASRALHEWMGLLDDYDSKFSDDDPGLRDCLLQYPLLYTTSSGQRANISPTNLRYPRASVIHGGEHVFARDFVPSGAFRTNDPQWRSDNFVKATGTAAQDAFEDHFIQPLFGY